MAVQKIVYVTPGEETKGELTHVGVSQLRYIANHSLQLGETCKNLTKVFRMTEGDAPLVGESLKYLCANTDNILNNGKENMYHTFISDPMDRENIFASTELGEMVVVGVTRSELHDIMIAYEDLGYLGYQEYMDHSYNVYAYTIDLEHKDYSGFDVAEYRSRR